MSIPTEPIGSIPRSLDAVERYGADDPRLPPLYDAAVRDTIERGGAE